MVILVVEYPLILSNLVCANVDEVNLSPTVEGAADYWFYIVWFRWVFVI
jgi:hypothetical protein